MGFVYRTGGNVGRGGRTMGNWNRANVVGTCAPSQVNRLREALAVDFMNERWGYLCSGGAAGLPNWGDEKFDVVGNLGERDPDAGIIGDHLETLRKECPSLRLKIHVGKDGESDECDYTITVEPGKDPVVGDAEIKELRVIGQDQMWAQTMAMLQRRPG